MEVTAVNLNSVKRQRQKIIRLDRIPKIKTIKFVKVKRLNKASIAKLVTKENVELVMKDRENNNKPMDEKYKIYKSRNNEEENRDSSDENEEDIVSSIRDFNERFSSPTPSPQKSKQNKPAGLPECYIVKDTEDVFADGKKDKRKKI